MSVGVETSVVEEAAKAEVRRLFDAPQIESHYHTITGWEDFEIEGDVETKILGEDDDGVQVEVRIKCSGSIRVDDFDHYEEADDRPRYYFLTGKVFVYKDDGAGERLVGWLESFPKTIDYEDLQGEGSVPQPPEDFRDDE